MRGVSVKVQTRQEQLKALFESMYILLLLDRYTDGLWGRSTLLDVNRKFTSDQDAALEIKEQQGSITMTYVAIEAICAFTRDVNHTLIKATLSCLKDRHRDKESGGFGTRWPISNYPRAQYKVNGNSRHTASAVLIFLTAQGVLGEIVVQGIEFLLKNQKGGGWGTDPKSNNTDCYSTALALKALSYAKKIALEESHPEKFLRRLDLAAQQGLRWLNKNLRRHFWVFDDPNLKLKDTAFVLATVPDLELLEPNLTDTVLSHIIECRNSDGGWPLTEGSRSHLTATAWVMRALTLSKRKEYEELIHTATSFIIQNYKDVAYLNDPHFCADGFAAILQMSDYFGLPVRLERHLELDTAAAALMNGRLRRSSRDFKFITNWAGLRLIVPQFGRRSIIQRVESLPLWVKWTFNAIFMAIATGIIASFLYSMLS